MSDLPKTYKVLDHQEFSSGDHKIVPLRFQDRYKIMQWRNDQMYHLRQAEPLTKEKQDAYFENVVAKLFDEVQPDQVLFSFLRSEKCIGYGGLVHVNWVDKNAEVSFIMDTGLEAEQFHLNWSIYLDLIEEVAFKELGLHKVYVYAFDIREHLYEVLEESGFVNDARLKEHSLYNNEFIDVVIYSKWEEQ